MLASLPSETLAERPFGQRPTAAAERHSIAVAETEHGGTSRDGPRIQRPYLTTSAFFELELLIVAARESGAFQSRRRAPTGEPLRLSYFDLLAILAEEEDPTGFIQLVSQLDRANWREGDYTRATRLALRAGANRLAGSLAEEGRERYPDHPDLRRLAELLAPRPEPGKRLPARPALKINREWFIQHAAQYRGQWVAVKDGLLLGAAPTLSELKAKIGETRSATLSKVV
jgi:hypothetical protein